MSRADSGPIAQGYRMHVFVCAHERSPKSSRGCCADKNSLELMTRLKRAAKQAVWTIANPVLLAWYIQRGSGTL